MQYYFHTFGDVIGHRGWHADAQVDIRSIKDVLCDPLGQAAGSGVDQDAGPTDPLFGDKRHTGFPGN